MKEKVILQWGFYYIMSEINCADETDPECHILPLDVVLFAVSAGELNIVYVGNILRAPSHSSGIKRNRSQIK